MKKLSNDRLATLAGGELSGASLCGVAIGVSLLTGGWTIFAAVGFCFLANPTDAY